VSDAKNGGLHVASIKKLLSKKNAPLYGGAFFLILIVLFVFFFLRNPSNDKKDLGPVVFKFETEEVHQSELDSTVKYFLDNNFGTKEYVHQLAFENYKKISLARKLGILPEDNTIDKKALEMAPQEFRDDTGKYEQYKGWFQMLAATDLIDMGLKSQAKANVKGYSHVLYFGQHIEYGENYTPEGLNDPALIAKDRDYAQERAKYYHSQLKDGKMSNDQIDKEIKADSKLKTFVNTVNPFGSNDPMRWSEEVYYPSIVDYINSASATGISEVMIGSGPAGPNVELNEQAVELYFYFVDLQESPGRNTVSKADFIAQLDKYDSEYLLSYDPQAYRITATNIKNDDTEQQPVSVEVQ